MLRNMTILAQIEDLTGSISRIEMEIIKTSPHHPTLRGPDSFFLSKVWRKNNFSFRLFQETEKRRSCLGSLEGRGRGMVSFADVGMSVPFFL